MQTLTFLLSLLGARAVIQTQQGEQVHCVQDRSHILRYDVTGEANDGSSLDGIHRAIVSLEPSPAHGELCTQTSFTPEGEKDFCYGANQDSTCTHAKTEIPINDDYTCKDCYVSVFADAYYKMDFSLTEMHSLQVGLNNTHVRASASLHSVLNGQATVASGSIPVFGSDTFTIIDTLVGCPVCVKVKIEVAAPTSVNYDVRVAGKADLQAGLVLDMDLGDNWVTYQNDAGWSHNTIYPTVTATPLLAASLDAEGDVELGINTQIQVIIDDIFWYHLNLNPVLPTRLTFDGDALHLSGDVCLDGTVKFSMTQEADLNWDLVVWDVKEHWGPSQLWSWQLPNPWHYCKHVEVPSDNSLVVV